MKLQSIRAKGVDIDLHKALTDRNYLTEVMMSAGYILTEEQITVDDLPDVIKNYINKPLEKDGKQRKSRRKFMYRVITVAKVNFVYYNNLLYKIELPDNNINSINLTTDDNDTIIANNRITILFFTYSDQLHEKLDKEIEKAKYEALMNQQNNNTVEVVDGQEKEQEKAENTENIVSAEVQIEEYDNFSTVISFNSKEEIMLSYINKEIIHLIDSEEVGLNNTLKESLKNR